MFVRAYLRASTKQQDATRAKAQLEAFATERGLHIAAFYVENESGASLERPALFELIADASAGDVLLIEQVDQRKTHQGRSSGLADLLDDDLDGRDHRTHV
jgi:DNA invertase Pin-like site-specific DNA recombinase